MISVSAEMANTSDGKFSEIREKSWKMKVKKVATLLNSESLNGMWCKHNAQQTVIIFTVLRPLLMYIHHMIPCMGRNCNSCTLSFSHVDRLSFGASRKG